MMIWKEVPGFPEYMINEYGSVKRVLSASGAIVGHILTQNKRGSYLSVTLSSHGISYPTLF